MTIITENGWPQIPSSMVDRGFIPGSETVRLETRQGDVSTILKGFAAWFDRNVEDIEFNYMPRDDWGYSATNSVWNSNHISATAIDLNATKYPMGRKNMPAWMVEKIEEGLRLFEGTVYWGRRWTGSNVDEMHFQIQGNAAQIAPFAEKLRGGYLGIWAPEKPRDPEEYPLPVGYYYGPLDGPNESVSGLYKTDSQWAKDSLGRWQEAAGIPVTKHWDEATSVAVRQIQSQLGWQGSPFYGKIYTGEWYAVVRDGWKYNPSFNEPAPEEKEGIYWADVSKYQQIPVDPSYPHRIFAFRVNTGNEVDALADRNYRAACALADTGKLDAIIAYSFFRPHSAGHATWETFRNFFEERGIHGKLLAMVDVENGKGSPLGEVKGDQSFEANGFVDLAAHHLFAGDRRRVLGYHNFRADPAMWLSLPSDLKMIRPNYSLAPGKGVPDGPNVFAHQFTQTGRCAPWGDRNVDLNYYPSTISNFLSSVGLGEPLEVKPPTPLPTPEPGSPRVITLRAGETLEVRVDG